MAFVTRENQKKESMKMGTNYYAVPNRPSLGHNFHIGKSSAGWLFCFRDQEETWNDPPVVWHSYNDVKEWLKKYVVDSKEYVILDEYEREVSFEEFFNLVDSKQEDPDCRSNPDNFGYCKNVCGYRFSDREFC